MRYLLCVVLVFTVARAQAQDTFSIVAVDTVTGEIGSAGASCVGPLSGVGAYIISDVMEGIGAIHTQASYLQQNQLTARQQMLLGQSPQQIIDWMIAHDAQGNPTIRQYGIVDLRRRGESAAYTGVNCIDYKGHATGPGYAVQGNILLGPSIIDTIKNVYLNTRGPLADRLMRSLEAARIIGADTRCASRGTSSRSAFIKVVRLGDGTTPYLLKIVPDSPVGTDPITLVRAQFDQWKDSLFAVVDPFLSRLLADRDTLMANGTDQAVVTIIPKNNSDSLLSVGRTILLSRTGQGTIGPVTDFGNGTYAATVTAPGTAGTDTISARVVSGTDTVRLAARVVLFYVTPTSVRGDGYEVPHGLTLRQNYPNPFNPTSTIEFALPRDGFVSLTLFDLSGRKVQTLRVGFHHAGVHRVVCDASMLGSGVYYYQLRSGSTTITRTLTVLR